MNCQCQAECAKRQKFHWRVLLLGEDIVLVLLDCRAEQLLSVSTCPHVETGSHKCTGWQSKCRKLDLLFPWQFMMTNAKVDDCDERTHFHLKRAHRMKQNALSCMWVLGGHGRGSVAVAVLEKCSKKTFSFLMLGHCIDFISPLLMQNVFKDMNSSLYVA